MLTAEVKTIRKMEEDAVISGIPEYELMLRAGVMAAEWIKKVFHSANRFVVLCGSGNNGGDALVCAGILSAGYPVVVYSTANKEKFSGCAANAVRDLPEDIPFYVKDHLTTADFRSGDVIIDGLLGIGFAGEVLRERVSNFIAVVNSLHYPVISLDLPSGINGDSGKAAVNGAVNADHTLTFGAPKPGLFLNDGAKLRGSLRVMDIGLNLLPEKEPMRVFTNTDAIGLLPDVAPDCHKNSRGRVAVWGSSPEYPGAAALCTLGALKSGAGIVRCASEADLSGRLCNAAIFQKLSHGEIPEKFLSSSDVLVCGCGWGSCAGKAGIGAALEFPGTVVLDADALNFVAGNPQVWKKRENIILTPHPGEGARLLAAFGVAASECRRENARNLAEKLHSVILWKGRDTVVASPSEEPVIIAAGTPLLATAGSGDVLAGVIGALASSGANAFDAACLGAYIHGIAGEIADRVIIADQLPELISQVLFQLRRNAII